MKHEKPKKNVQKKTEVDKLQADVPYSESKESYGSRYDTKTLLKYVRTSTGILRVQTTMSDYEERWII